MRRYDSELIPLLKEQGFDESRMRQLEMNYAIGEPNAVKTAIALGEKYREYLPLGGNAVENAEDIISAIHRYIESLE